MRLPAPKGRRASLLSAIDGERAAAQVRRAIDGGVNYLDTAYPYHAGSSESFLGEYILRDGYREKVNIATKLPCMTINSKDGIEKTFRRQMKNLRVDCIDYYLLHSLNGATWDKMISLGVIDFMDRIRKEGLVRHMGFSFHDSKEQFKRIVDGYDWEFAQIQINILDERAQAGLEGMRYASERGLGIIVMEPLRGGALAHNLPSDAQRVYDDAPVKRSPAQWALRWVWNHPEVTVVLSGMNNEDDIDENIQTASETLPGALTPDELAVTDSFRAAYMKSLQVGCTGCAYCMPCPAGINIPQAFLALNSYHMSSKLVAKATHALSAAIQTGDGKAHWTKSCKDCGQCEKKCPQGIKIRQTFRLVQRELEGGGTKALAAAARLFMNRGSRGTPRAGEI
jgi:predicted aldo/keto reductase-like oxidoreductase